MHAFHDPHVSPQFTRPTKVIHFRNLPFDLTIEEVREFCAPWGTVVAVKEKVGANKNQCFVEFASIDQAVSIVNHYASSANPASFRGRPTWLSYSGRDKLTNVSPTSDTPTPVLQVTVTNIAPDLVQSGAINLDLLNVVFGAFGFVKKVIVYNKPEGGITAWLQFLDATTAAQVRQTLQGQQIPRNLVNDHPNPPVLEMVFSSQPDLNIRTQSYCTRDFMNAALPWGDPDWNYISALLPVGPEGASNVLSVSFDSMTYPVTVDGIHTIFSTYGTVQKVHIFEREGKTIALVQYPDVRTADTAKQALEGHAMYDGGHNVMHVTYSKHRNLVIRPGERSRDYTVAAPGAPPSAAPMAGPGRPPAAGAAPAAQPPAGAPYGGHPAGPPAGAAPAGAYPPAAHAAPPAHAMGGPPHGMPPAAGGPPPQRPYGAPPAAGALPQGYAAPPQTRQHYDPNVVVTGEDFVRQHERVLQQAGGRIAGPPTVAYGAQPPQGAYGGYPSAPPAAGAPPPDPPPAAPYGAPPAGSYPPPPVGQYAPPPGQYYQPPPPPAAPGYGAPPPYPPPGMPPAAAAPPAAPYYGAAYGQPPPAQGYPGY